MLFNGTCVCFVTLFVGAHIFGVFLESEDYSLGVNHQHPGMPESEEKPKREPREDHSLPKDALSKNRLNAL